MQAIKSCHIQRTNVVPFLRDEPKGARRAVSTEGGENLFWNREPGFVESVDMRRHMSAKSEKRRAVKPE